MLSIPPFALAADPHSPLASATYVHVCMIVHHSLAPLKLSVHVYMIYMLKQAEVECSLYFVLRRPGVGGRIGCRPGQEPQP